jgi:hypothetical protein
MQKQKDSIIYQMKYACPIYLEINHRWEERIKVVNDNNILNS